MQAYRPPPRLTALANRVVAWLAARGLTPRGTVTLEVRGRRSGAPRLVVLTWTKHARRLYFVSLHGDAEWVRNVRAAGGEAILRHGRAYAVRLQEVPVEQRAPVLKAYLEQRALTKSPAQSAKQYFGLPPHPSVEALAAVAAHYPVFRILPWVHERS